MKEKSKKVLKKYGIIAIIVIVGFLIVSIVSQTLTPPLPNYSVEGDKELWQNTITDAGGAKYRYRREVIIENPTDFNLTGTHGFRLNFYQPWFGGRKVLKVDYGIVKVVKTMDNPVEDSAKLLREVPAYVTAYDVNTLNVFFDYSVDAKSTQHYYIYSKQDMEYEDIYKQSLTQQHVGYASMGGFVTNISSSGFTTHNGFTIGSTYFKNVDISGGSTIWQYYEERTFDSDNRYPNFPEFTLYGSSFSTMSGIVYGTAGMRTSNPIEAKNKYILVTGARNPFEYYTQSGRGYIGFFNGEDTPGNTQDSDHSFVGVELVEDSDTFTTPSDHAERLRKYVADFRYHYADGSISALQTNNYVVGSDWSDLLDSEVFVVDFDYIFEIDANGQVFLTINENGFGHQSIMPKVNLGTLPWSTTYFQMSTPNSYLYFKYAFIGDSDVYQAQKINGVKVNVAYEKDLESMQSLSFQNSYAFILGIITLIMVGIYLLKRIIPHGKEIVTDFCIVLLVISIYLIVTYHPLRYIWGLEDGAWYIGRSDMGIGFLYDAGQENMFFYYFLYLAIPISGILLLQAAKKGNGTLGKLTQDSGSQAMSRMTIIPLIILGLSIIFLFFETTFIYWSFYLLCLGIIVVAAKQYFSGYSGGGDTKSKEGKKSFGKRISALIAYVSFIYFVIKIIIEAYKVLGAVDPFTILEPSEGFSVNSLGSVAGVLQSYGIPLDAIDLIAIIMSDYITIIVICINVLKTALKTEGDIYTRFNAVVWVVYIYFMVRVVEFPFFTLAISMLYVSGWILGNILGKIPTEDLGLAATKAKKEKAPKSKKQPKLKKEKKSKKEKKTGDIIDEDFDAQQTRGSGPPGPPEEGVGETNYF